MPERITDDDRQLLDELGIETESTPAGARTPKEQRIIAGFEEIERWTKDHGRPPQHGENRDIFERIYAVRLDRIRESAECRGTLSGVDPQGLLGPEIERRELRAEEAPSDDALLSELGMSLESTNDITKLVHVRPRDEIKAAEEIAQRNPCRDFAVFKPLFAQVQQQLTSGERRTIPYKDNAETKKGDLFIIDGQKVIVADMGEPFVSDYGRPDRRLRVVYDNGTESDLLLRSLQRALNKDKASRRITAPDMGPLFSDQVEKDDISTGVIYILRSKSEHPFVAQNRSIIHKIGVTGGDVKSRVGNASKDPTYLLADVEIVATFKLANINRNALEALIHKFFSGARLDVGLKDRFGGSVEPREWFLVPLEAIEDAVQKLMEGSLHKFRYDPAVAKIVRVEDFTR